MDNLLNVGPTAFGAMAGRVFDNVAFEKAKLVGVDVFHRLNLERFVMRPADLIFESVHNLPPFASQKKRVLHGALCDVRFDAIFIHGFLRDDVVFEHRPIIPGLHLAHRANAPGHLNLSA